MLKFILFFCVYISSVALAQNTETSTAPAPAPQVTPVSGRASVGKGNFKMVYGSAAWNSDSTKQDSAFLFMRDKKTGKIVKIQLEETEPDSSIFSGNFAINLGKDIVIDPEVFIPPRDMKDNADAVKKFSQLLSTGKISAKPLLTKTSEGGARVVDVYDTKDQVAKAEMARLAEESAKRDIENSKLVKPVLNEQDIETAKMAEQKAKLDLLALEAAQRESERVRSEQLERQKNLERERISRELSEKQREENRKKAAELAEQALKHYQLGEFPEAETKFRQAVDLDPENKSYYFKYGVTLYRNEKFNDALVVIKLSPDDPQSVVEKKYYMGLIHLRLKELDAALASMKEVGAHKESELAASAAFYEGIIFFTQEEYEKAKEPFERVIDLSKDPRLDEQAEDYLDKLTGLIQQKKLMGRKWFLNGMVGTMYDSNVLYAPDGVTSQGSSSSAGRKGDIRYQLSADGEYRPLYTNSKELGIKGMAYYMYSTSDAVSQADPFLLNVSAPFTYKGMALGKGYKFALKPAYEIVYMDADQNSTRELILKSIVVAGENTFVMRKDWFAAYTIELRNDDSLTQDSTGDNNADAAKVTIKTAQTLLLDKSMKRAVIGSAGWVVNSAQGDEKYYNRYDLGVNYMAPLKDDYTWNSGLSYYMLKYEKGSTKRVDNNLAFNLGLTKPVKEWWSWNVSGNYTTNASSVSSSQYSRYTISASAIFNYSL